MADLSGPRAKAERAEEHIREFEAAVSGLTFSHTENPDVILRERDAAGHHTIYKAGDIPSVPPQVPEIAGDAIHNLHAALDRLMTQLVERAGNMPANRVTPYFPSGDSRESFEARLTPKVERLIGKDALDQIRAAEPYRGGKGEAAWYVHHLDVEDKHRVAYTLAAHTAGHTIPLSFTNTLAGDVSDLFTPEQKAALINLANQTVFNAELTPLQKGVPLLIFPGEPENDPQFPFEVAFREPEIVQTQAVLPILTEYAKATTALIESFAPLF